jgi:hypothetical protein
LIVPNKVITLRESALGRAPKILQEQSKHSDLIALYDSVSKEFESIDQFLLSLDILFILGRIDVDVVTRVVTYAD